jgi:high-affinity iron transporter
MAGATETAERHAICIGVVAGTVALALAFVGLRKVTFMVPIGPVFTATSVLLYVLAVIFAGQGVASFQESGVIGATFVGHVPTLPMLGLYPTIQTLIAQGILLVLAMAALVLPMTKKIRLPARTESPYDIRRAG